MKIVAKSPKAVPGSVQARPLVLGDDSASDFISNFLPEEIRRMQAKGGYQQPFVKPLDRFNKTRKATWAVDRTFKAVNDCDMFVRDHPAQVPTNCNLEVTVGTNTETYGDCFIENVKCTEHAGLSCVFQYTATLGDMI